jgi:hypothetical protein
MIQWNIVWCAFFGLLHNCSRTLSSHLFSLMRNRMSCLILWHNTLVYWFRAELNQLYIIKKKIYIYMSSYLQNFVNFPIMWPVLPSNLARNLAQSWQANARYCLPLTCKIITTALRFITACSFVGGYKGFVLLSWRRRRQMFYPDIW